jgi:hypothetical protein
MVAAARHRHKQSRSRHVRKETWRAENPDGRRRCFTYDEIAKRDKMNLDIFWLKDKSLEDSENLPEPVFSRRRSPTICRRRWSSSAPLPAN